MEIRELIPAGEEKAFEVGQRRQGMTLGDLPDRHRALLDGAVTASLVTMNTNGTPQLTPVWAGADDTHVLVNSVRGRLKDRNLRARPNLSLLFVDPEDSYRWLTITGHVDELIDEDDPERGQEATETINAFSKLYLGHDVYPLRDPRGGEVRTLYRVAPTKIVVFG